MKRLNKDIREKSFQNVYLLYGNDSYLRRTYKKNLRDAVLSGDTMNLTELYGKEATLPAVMEAIALAPFFSEKRVVTVESSDWLAPSKKEKGAQEAEHEKERGKKREKEQGNEQRKGKADWAPFLEALNQIPSSTVLIFAEEKADKKNALFKKIAELGYCAELNHPSAEELKQWAAKQLQFFGKKITPANMDRFLEYVGNDMEFVRKELEKLIAYTGEREVIEHSDLDCITTILSEGQIFKMVDAIVAGQKSLAMSYYRALYENNEAPMRMIILITKRFQRLLAIKELLLRGEDKNRIKNSLSLNWAEEKMIAKVRGYDRNALRNHVLRGLLLDREIKRGRMSERMAVELLLSGEGE